MATNHSREEISALLGRKKLATLATAGPGSLRTRCMFFAHDGQFNIYLMATTESAKLREMRVNPDVSLLVIDEDRMLFETVEIEIQGRAEMVADQEQKMAGLKLLAPKCPFAQFAIESGGGDAFEVVRVKPKVLIYRVYGEASTGVGATVLTF